METIYENKEICAKCGGMCCKKSGCDYSPKDFVKVEKNYLYNRLMEGKISIVSAQNFTTLSNGRVINNPILYLRARNVNRGIVDLFSFKTTCSQLTEFGCAYLLEDRPFGGVNLIPHDDKPCHPEISPIEILKTWFPYQNILAKLVKRINGKSVNEQMKIDVYNLFTNVFNKNFAGVSPVEIEDVLEGLPLLSMAYPEEYEKARNDYLKVHGNIFK